MDIDRPKLVEERLRLQAAALDAAGNAILITDKNGAIVWTNRAFSELTGYVAAEACGKNPRLLSSGQHDKAFYAHLWQTITAGEIWHGEMINRRKDGRLYTEEQTITPVCSNHGEITHFVAIKQDVTERKRIEDALQQAEAKYRALFEESADATWLMDENGFLACNSAALQLFGYSTADLMRHPTDISPPNQPDGTPSLTAAEQRIAAAFLNGKERFEWLHQRKDGTVFPADVCLTALMLSGRRTLLATVRDMTERKRAEEALAREHMLLRTLIDNMPDYIYAKDTNHRFLLANEALASRMGAAGPDELLGKSDFDFYPPGVAAKYAQDEQQILQSGQSVVDREESTIDAVTGRIVWHTTSEVPLRGQDGNILGLLGIGHNITERKRVEETLRRQEEDYRRFVAQSSEGIFREDLVNPVAIDLPEDEVISRIRRDSYVTECNDALAKMYGFASAQELIGKRLADMLVPDDPGNLDLMREYVRGGFRILERATHEVDQQGNAKTFLNSMIGVVENKMLMRSWGIQRDVTERVRAEEARKKVEQALQASEAHFRLLVEQASDGIFLSDAEGRYLDVNSAGAEMLGYTRDEILQLSIADVIAAQEVPRIAQEVARLAGGAVARSEWKLRRKDGSSFPGEMMGRRLPDGRMQGILRDISERKRAEERIQFFAFYDALTELPNRTLLQDRLLKAFAGARRRKEKVALLFLDLDRFKIINDSLGHAVGDLVLQSVARRIRGLTRELDTVARLGGDEFLLVVNAVKEIGDAAVAADRLLKALTAEFVVQGHSLNVTCSIGISVFPDHGLDAETLVKNADAAMYCAKENGRNNFQFFTEDMNAEAVERLALERDLRKALEGKELFLAYQPQMDMATGRLIGLEALLRWRHPEMGLVPPDKFIRIAENSGLIVPIGEWVLRTACTQVRAWHDEGLLAASVAVNVSPVQFRQEGFCQLIRQVLRETRLAPHHLELELTESLLLSSADTMLSVLRELKDMGVKLAIDDFGTGYSSLSYLSQFPVSKLKIDRSFVKNVTVNPNDAAIAATIISMAKSLRLKVIAEGVETEEQMSFLRAHLCGQIQGYYFCKPLPANELSDKLRGSGISLKKWTRG